MAQKGRSSDFLSRRAQKGQSFVEYLMMTAVVVGLVIAVGGAIIRFMPGLMGNISEMIAAAVGGESNSSSSGGTSGSGGNKKCGTAGLLHGVGFGVTCDDDVAVDMVTTGATGELARLAASMKLLPEIKKN
jgi:hypothetical protein